MPTRTQPPHTATSGVEEAQLGVVRRGMRIGAAVATVQMAGFMMISASHSFQSSLLPPAWFWGLMALCEVSYCVVALRPDTTLRTLRQAVIELTLLLTMTMALCSATGPIHLPGQAFAHTSVIAILFGCAVLVPFPVRMGAVSMSVIAAAYPIVQWMYPGNEDSSLQLAMATVNITLGLGAALFMLTWHDRMHTSSQQAAGALADIVQRDSLTGLLSRATIESHGRRTVHELNSGRDVVVCVVDIDRFKRFNTEYGYAAGDEVLKEVGRRLLATVGSPVQSHVGRTGGEEFVVVCPTERKEDMVSQVEAFLRIMREERFSVGNEELRLSASIGLASARELAVSDWDSVLHAADQAMYRAKYRGGQQFNMAQREDLAPVLAVTGSSNRSHDRLNGTQLGAAWIQRDREHIHTALLCIALCLCALWQPSLLVMDIVRVREGLTGTPLASWVVYRAAGCILSAVAAWYLANSQAARTHTGWLHGAFSLVMVLTAVFGAGADGAMMGPFGLCVASVGLIVWSLALSLPTWLVFWSSFGLAAVYLLLPPVLLQSDSLENMPLLDHVYRLMTIASVLALAFSGRQHFMALRDEESLMRHELGLRSTIDALTGLPNRRALQQRMQRVVALASRERHVSLMLLDIDHFKQINDEHGHAVGDQVIVKIAHFLESVAPTGALVARHGGEEFAIVLVHGDDSAAAELAHRIVAGARTLRSSRIERPTTLSIGVANWQHGETEDAWMKQADVALRQAKREGRDRVIVAGQRDDTLFASSVPWVRSATNEL